MVLEFNSISTSPAMGLASSTDPSAQETEQLRVGILRIKAYLKQLIEGCGAKDKESLRQLVDTALDSNTVNVQMAVSNVMSRLKEEISAQEAEQADEELAELIILDQQEEKAALAMKASKAKIAARSCKVNPDDARMVAEHYKTYMHGDKPEEVQDYVIHHLQKSKVSRRLIIEANGVDATSKEVVAGHEEYKKQRERVDALLMDERYKDGDKPQNFILNKIKKKHLFADDGISQLLDQLEKGTLNPQDEQVWLTLNNAETSHNRRFRANLLEMVETVHKENPQMHQVCTKMSNEKVRDLFEQIEADPELRKEVYRAVKSMKDGKKFSDLSDRMQKMVASFTMCESAETLVEQSLFIDRAKSLYRFAHTPATPGMSAETIRRKEEMKALYDKLDDKNLGEKERSELLVQLVVKYDVSLQKGDMAKLDIIRAQSEEMIRQIDQKGEKSVLAINTVARDPSVERVSLQGMEAVAGPVKRPVVFSGITAALVEMNKQIDVKHFLSDLKEKHLRFDAKTEKAFGLNGDVEHDVKAITEALGKANVKLTDYNINGNTHFEAPEVTAAMQKAMEKLDKGSKAVIPH